MIILKALTVFLVCLFAACGNPVANQPDKTELSLKMERTECNRICPAYVLTVGQSGKVLFDGINHTQTKGKAEGQLSEGQIKHIIAEINKADFFSLKDAYTSESGNCPNFGTDFATVTLSVKLNGREKTIKHNLGCMDQSSKTGVINFPPDLQPLEYKIDEITETKRWIGEIK